MKKTKKPTNKNPSPGFTAEFYKETEYYFENGKEMHSILSKCLL